MFSSRQAEFRVAACVLIWSDVCGETRARPCRDNLEPRPVLMKTVLKYPLWPDHYHTARPDGKVVAWPKWRGTGSNYDKLLNAIICVFHVSVSEGEQRRVTSRDLCQTHNTSSEDVLCDVQSCWGIHVKVRE